MGTHAKPSATDHSAKKSIRRQLQRWLLTGLILVAPASVTFLALKWMFTKVDGPLREALAHLTGYDIPGAGLVLVLLLLTATGAVASNFLLRGFVGWVEATLGRIPLVRTLYSGVKQLVAPLADEGRGGFQKVVMIQYPDLNNYALGFLIKPDAAVSPTGELLSAVLVPTNHLHLGSVVLCPDSHIFDVDMNAEEGLRFLVSMGSALEHRLQLRPITGPMTAAAAGAPPPESR